MILDIQLEQIHPCINPILLTKNVFIKCGNECGTDCGIKFFSVVFSTVRDLVSGVLILVADIIKMTDIPTFSGQKTDMLIGFGVVGLAKNNLWLMN